MVNLVRVRRKKHNLVRQIGRKTMKGYVWFIGKQQAGNTFYISDYDDEKNTAVWTKKKIDGISFNTERALQRFIHKHLHNRNDIILIQAPPD